MLYGVIIVTLVRILLTYRNKNDNIAVNTTKDQLFLPKEEY